MKKAIAVFLVLLLMLLPIIGYCASVTPTTIKGNDENPNKYTPPVGCVRITLPDKLPGSYTYKFNDNGQLDSSGTNIFTLTIVKIQPKTYNEVSDWSWNGSYPLSAVIVKGGPAFNLYEYNGQTSDTNLTAPLNPSGKPYNINHVSIVICPQNQPTPPTPTPTVIAIIVALLLLALAPLFLCRRKHDNNHITFK
ncbi:MAG: hypothetical protein Q8882_01960 [Bacillota bacterium]|nr:hypothetical protein [Bacillota bacterium]